MKKEKKKKKKLYRISFWEKVLLKISLIYVYNLYFSYHSCGGGYKHCRGECLCCRWGVCVVLVVLVQSLECLMLSLRCFLWGVPVVFEVVCARAVFRVFVLSFTCLCYL